MRIEITLAVYLDSYEKPNNSLIEKEIEVLEEIVGKKATFKTINGKRCIVCDIEFSEFYNKTKMEILKRIDNMNLVPG